MSSRAMFARAVVICALTASAAAWSAGGHDHHHGGASVTREQSGKWKTDATLRAGMTRIHQALVRHVDTGAPAERLAASVRGEVDTIIANCRLDPAADAALHGVLGQLLDGARALEGAETDRGLVQIREALEAYGRQFRHPGWPPS